MTTVPTFLAGLLAPFEMTPNCNAVMLLFSTRLLSLRVPRLLLPMVLLPKPTPASVVVLALPEMFRFLIVLFVVGLAVPIVCPQMTALTALVLLFVSVISRLLPPELEPSMVT